MKTLVTFIKFHRVIQMASCDQIGDYHWLNCSWIINEFEKKYVTTWKLFTPTWYNLHGWRSVLHLEVEPLFINAKKIKVKCTLIQSQSTVFSSSQAMAQRKVLCFRNASVNFVVVLSTRSIATTYSYSLLNSKIKTCFALQNLWIVELLRVMTDDGFSNRLKLTLN
jgi:hypothetical protein